MSKQLTQEQRYQLYHMIGMSLKQNEMARILGVSASTISRELKRNRNTKGRYTKEAHKLALDRRKSKSKPRLRSSDWKLVESFLKLDFSPEQISDWFKRWKLLRVSHEWIYQYIRKNKQCESDS